MTGDRREKVQAAFLALIMVTSVMTASVAFTGSAVVADTSTGSAAANPVDADTSINDADHTYVLNLSATGTDFSDTLGDGTGTDTITISNSNGSQFDRSGVTASEIVVGVYDASGNTKAKYTSSSISSVTADSSKLQFDIDASFTEFDFSADDRLRVAVTRDD